MVPYELIKRLEDDTNLVDTLIQTEDFLDSLNLYVYANWIDGEVVDGPHIEKYWVKLTLKYPYKKMPDPKGGMILIKYGVKVVYKEAKQEVPVSVDTSTLARAANKQPQMKLEPIWLIDLKVPRRFVDSFIVGNVDLDNADVDADEVQAARDAGIDVESSHRTNGYQEPSEESGLFDLDDRAAQDRQLGRDEQGDF